MEFDFHLHSHYSDGRISPAELVQEAKRLGLKAVALTDHENVSGISEALNEGRILGVKVIPGIEIAVADTEDREQHLLGLLIDYENQELRNFLASWKASKIQQIQMMIKNLKEKGFEVEFEDVLSQSKGSVNRPHIAYAVFGKKENSEILEKMGIKTLSEFFERLLTENSPETVFAERERPGIEETIKMIKKVGGVAVWAHPFWKKQVIGEIEQKCRLFQALGLGAIEVCYNRIFFNSEKAVGLHQIAQELGLYETAGSDFHSFEMSKFNKLVDFETFGLKLRLPPGCEP